MSRHDWEKGTIKLPSAEFARLRKALQEAEAARKDKAFELTQEFWKGLTRKEQTDPAAYSAAQRKFFDAKHQATEKRVYRPFGGSATETDHELAAAVSEAYWQAELKWQQAKPARVHKADMNFPTNRSTSFNADDGHISFDREAGTVEWHVSENNHAVERAHEHPMARTFFSELAKVRWTRGTGGVFTGNDEYNRDTRDEGGGANYVTTAYGPIGAAEAPDSCQPYTDSQGNRVTQDQLWAMHQKRFQAQMDAQRKADAAYAKAVKASGVQPRGHNGHRGKFTYKTHGEPDFRL